ncbi:MAG: metalloregulator ArsR/SmtB family transcription factor [Thermoanaerobaculia bacterium]
MKTDAAVDRLAALAHASRLAVFRRLVKRGPTGMAAGEIAAALDLPAPTLSFHLAHLSRAGLVQSRRDGRSIVYSADYGAIGELVGYLYQHCCGDEDSAGASALVEIGARTKSTRSTS